MNKQTQEETQAINGLLDRVKYSLQLKFESNTELIDFIVKKMEYDRFDLNNYDYQDAVSIADEIARRVERLKMVRKQQKVEDRIKDIIDSIQY